MVWAWVLVLCCCGWLVNVDANPGQLASLCYDTEQTEYPTSILECPSGVLLLTKAYLGCSSEFTDSGVCDTNPVDSCVTLEHTIKPDCDGRRSCDIDWTQVRHHTITKTKASHQFNYLKVHYYCIPDSKLVPVCSDIRIDSTQEAYLVSSDVVGAPTPLDHHNCSCKIYPEQKGWSQLSFHLGYIELMVPGTGGLSEQFRIRDMKGLKLYEMGVDSFTDHPSVGFKTVASSKGVVYVEYISTSSAMQGRFMIIFKGSEPVGIQCSKDMHMAGPRLDKFNTGEMDKINKDEVYKFKKAYNTPQCIDYCAASAGQCQYGEMYGDPDDPSKFYFCTGKKTGPIEKYCKESSHFDVEYCKCRASSDIPRCQMSCQNEHFFQTTTGIAVIVGCMVLALCVIILVFVYKMKTRTRNPVHGEQKSTSLGSEVIVRDNYKPMEAGERGLHTKEFQPNPPPYTV